MTMMTAIAAVPAVALPTVAKAGFLPDRAAWDRAFARYQTARAMQDRLWEALRRAEEGFGNAHPREDRYFDELRLGIGMKRDNVVRTVTGALCMKRYARPNSFSPLSEGEKREACRQINSEADRIADEFMAYQAEHKEGRRRFRIDELNDRASDFMDSDYLPARDALMGIPAPDQAALLAKIEIAGATLEEGHSEAVLEDAKRLLAIN